MVTIRVPIGDETAVLTFKSAAEAARFVALLQRNAKPRRRRKALPESEANPAAGAEARTERLKRGLAALLAIRGSGESGISSKDLAEEMGLKGAHGLGKLLGATKTALAELGFEEGAAIAQIRGPEHARTWVSRPKIDDAVRALSERLGVRLPAHQEEDALPADDLPF